MNEFIIVKKPVFVTEDEQVHATGIQALVDYLDSKE